MYSDEHYKERNSVDVKSFALVVLFNWFIIWSILCCKAEAARECNKKCLIDGYGDHKYIIAEGKCKCLDTK